MAMPIWSAIGIFANAFALALSGFANIIVCFYSESPLDTVLNVLALFFIVDCDNLIVSMYECFRFKNALLRIIEASQQDKDIKVSVELPRFLSSVLKFVTGLLIVVRVFLLVSPVFILVCKLGVPFDGDGRTART